jgi:hypothetical protein
VDLHDTFLGDTTTALLVRFTLVPYHRKTGPQVELIDNTTVLHFGTITVTYRIPKYQNN